MFTDELRRKVWDCIRQHDFRLLGRYLTPNVLTEAGRRAGIRLGRGPLGLVNLVWLAVLSALETTKNFANILSLTLRLLQDQEGFAASALSRAQGNGRRARRRRRSRHDPRPQDPTAVSEEAFVKARRRLPWPFWTALLLLLNERFARDHGARLRWRGLRLVALDGTVLDLPAWQRLRGHYGTARGGRGRNAKTQARLVLLQFPQVRLPLAAAVVPLKVGEISAANGLVEHLQADDLLLMDRGFFSYGLFWRIQQRGAYFAIRLKKDIGLRRRRALAPGDRLVRWRPADTRGQWKKQGWPPAIDLRLLRYQVPGFRATALLTNLLDARRASRADWVRLATADDAGRAVDPGLYHRRWEIETTLRELKVLQRLEGGLRGRTPAAVEYEIGGHLVLYLVVRWLMVEAAAEGEQDPLRLSFVEALREVQAMAPALRTARPSWAKRVLLPRLRRRIASHLVPLRPGRSYPRPKDGKTKDRGHGQKQRPAKLKGKQG
jgi:hypothetical protein